MERSHQVCTIGDARSRSGWRRWTTALFAGVLALTAPAEIDAQPAGESEVRISAPAKVSSNGATSIALDIAVAPTALLPPNAFVRIRGLPEASSLSEGYAVAMGSWAVSIKALAGLKANVPAGLAGTATLSLQLVSMEGVVMAEASTVLVLEAAAPPPAPARSVESKPEAPRALDVPDRPRLSPDERQRAEKLLGQGERYLESGNVAIARQFFQRASDIGLAVAALRLAATYDPNELTRIGAQGVVPSPAEARKWYERAKQLGAPEADERIAKLTN